MNVSRSAMLAVFAATVACAPKMIHEEPILQNGDRVDDGSGVVYEASVQAEADRNHSAADRGEIEADAPAPP